MSKIPKPLIEAVEDALKTGRKASGAMDMASVRQSLPEQIVPKKRAVGVPKKPDPVVEERMPAPEGMRYETIMYNGKPTTVLVEDMDFSTPVAKPQVKPANAK